MASDPDIDEIERKAKTAGYADGLLEIFAAFVLALIAASLAASPGLVGVMAAFVVLYGWKVFERVKERVTYPRIGYSRERADDPGKTARGILLFMAGAFLVMVLVIWLSGGLTDASEWRRAAPLMSGITLAGGFWYAGEQSRLVRYRLIAGLSLLGGITMWLVGTGDSYDGVMWHLLGLAVPLALVGGWSLIRFVRSHPVASSHQVEPE